jgi:hypothetical protein
MILDFNKKFALFIALSISILSNAQNETDVLRYLNNSPFGTARVSSMAGSFGALGGDVTTALINPAGIGIYRKRELSLTPGFSFNNVNSNSEGESALSTMNKFIFSNVGFVNSWSSKDSKNFYLNYSFGYNKTLDFNRNSSVSYYNYESSMLFSFTDRAFGIPSGELANYDPFSSYLAYETYLIDAQMDTPVYYTTQPLYEDSFSGVYQSNSVTETGSGGDLFFNLALALDEKVYLGATMTILLGNYEMNSSFSENTINDSLLLNRFSFNYNQKSTFSGFDLKLGVIVKPDDWLRIGLAWHLPYYISIEDEFSTSVMSQWKDGDLITMASPDGSISYDLKHPGKWILSVALVKGTTGLINIGFEWLNYRAAEFSSEDFDFSPENSSIEAALRNTITARVGGELWFGRYNIRGGYALRQDPYSHSENRVKDFYNTLSAGAGMVSDNNFFINFSFSYKEGGASYYPYGKDIAPIIKDELNIYELLLSIGVRF